MPPASSRLTMYWLLARLLLAAISPPRAGRLDEEIEIIEVPEPAEMPSHAPDGAPQPEETPAPV